MPGLTGKLVDEEGFPRADIDLYAVRGARHRLHVLKTDYMEVRDQIEKELHALHAQGRVPVPRTSPAARATTSAGTADESDGNGFHLCACIRVSDTDMTVLLRCALAVVCFFQESDIACCPCTIAVLASSTVCPGSKCPAPVVAGDREGLLAAADLEK